jgi:hypothetical protein
LVTDTRSDPPDASAKPEAGQTPSGLDRFLERQGWAKGFRCRYKLSSTYPKGSIESEPLFGGDGNWYPPSDETHSTINALECDLQRYRIRKEGESISFDYAQRKFVGSPWLCVFDGTQLRILSPQGGVDGVEPHQSLVLYTKEHEPPVLQNADSPAFFGIGTIPSVTYGFDFRRLLVDLKSFVKFHGRSPNGLEVYKSSPQLFGSKAYHEEFWCDASRAGAIVKYHIYADSAVTDSIDVEYQQTGGKWLPRRAVNRKYNPQEGLKREVVVDILEYTLLTEIKDSTFRIPQAPGMRVEDLKTRRRSLVAEDGVTLLPLPTTTAAQSGSWSWWLVLLVCPAVILAGLLLWRHRQRARLA